MDLGRIRPLADKVLVRRDPMLDRTEGGLWAPEEWGSGVHPYAFRRTRELNDSNTKARYRLTGLVVAVGPGGWSKRGERVPMQLEPGMRVRFLDEGEDVKLGDEHDYVMLREDDCVAEELPAPSKLACSVCGKHSLRHAPTSPAFVCWSCGVERVYREHHDLIAPVVAEATRRWGKR